MKSLFRVGKLPLRVEWLLIILSLCVWTYFIQWLHISEVFDRIAYDTVVRFSPQPADERIVIIKIDNQSLNQYGQWPWVRAQHARLIERINQQHPAGVLLDVLFVEPSVDSENDKALSQSLRATKNVVLPALLTTKQNMLDLDDAKNIEVYEPIPILQSSAKVGYSATQPDSDNTIRSARLSVHLPTQSFDLISAKLLETDISAGDTRNLLIPYTGAMGHYANYSYAQVLSGSIPKDLFKGKYVLIGATATGMNDLHKTPYGLMSGVEIHANLLDGFLNHRQWVKASPIAQYLGSIVPMCLLMLVFLLSNERFHLMLLVLSIAFFNAGILLGFRSMHVWFAPTVGVLNLLIAYLFWDWRRLSTIVSHLQQQLANMQDKLPSDEPKSSVCRVQDYTVERTIREIDRLQTRLNVLDQSNREMIAFLSHDLRTPQVSILSAVHLFEQKNTSWQTDTERQKLLVQIKSNAQQTINFARDIVELSQIRDNRMQCEEHNLGHLIYFAFEKTYIQAQSKHIQLTRQFDDHYEEWAWVYVDGALIERALINLITNAIRYSPEHSEITIGLTQKDHRIFVSVTDQGVGMDAAVSAQLLAPSNTDHANSIDTKPKHHSTKRTQPDAAGSMGIGWRMIRAIIDKHNGSIDIKTQAQMGTTVIFGLQKIKETRSNPIQSAFEIKTVLNAKK
ncbi:MAG: tmoS 1 [Burkholderiaceae bacterium]|nr:tmoS 1 [Burkholderiaceae bacterium]